MLILTRKVGEKIMIGGSVSVAVMEIRGADVKIGVDAPKNVKVYRKEIFDAINEENLAATRSTTAIPKLTLSAKKTAAGLFE